MEYFKPLSKVDLCRNLDSANLLSSLVAPNASGVTRDVWLGNYWVLKKDKGRVMNCEWEYKVYQHFKLPILGEVVWSEGRYNVMVKYNTKKDLVVEKLKEHVGSLYGRKVNEEEMEYLLQITNSLLYEYISNNKKLDNKLIERLERDERTKEWGWRGDREEKSLRKLIENIEKNNIGSQLLLLPPQSVYDLHSKNWALDEKGELKIIDY